MAVIMWYMRLVIAPISVGGENLDRGGGSGGAGGGGVCFMPHYTQVNQITIYQTRQTLSVPLHLITLVHLGATSCEQVTSCGLIRPSCS